MKIWNVPLDTNDNQEGLPNVAAARLCAIEAGGRGSR